MTKNVNKQTTIVEKHVIEVLSSLAMNCQLARDMVLMEGRDNTVTT